MPFISAPRFHNAENMLCIIEGAEILNELIDSSGLSASRFRWFSLPLCVSLKRRIWRIFVRTKGDDLLHNSPMSQSPIEGIASLIREIYLQSISEWKYHR